MEAAFKSLLEETKPGHQLGEWTLHKFQAHPSADRKPIRSHQKMTIPKCPTNQFLGARLYSGVMPVSHAYVGAKLKKVALPCRAHKQTMLN